MENQLQPKKYDKLAWAQVGFILLFLLFSLYGYYANIIYHFIQKMILFPLMLGFAGMLFTRRDIVRKVEVQTLIAYVAWIAIAATASVIVFDKSPYEYYEYTIYHMIFSALACYPVAMMFDEHVRKKALHFILHGFLIVWAALCALAVVVSILQTSIEAPMTFIMGLNPLLNNRLCMFMHPNSVGAISSVSILLCVYMVLSHKAVLVKIGYVVAAMIMFLALALSDSRTNMVAVAVGIGLLAFLFVQRQRQIKRVYAVVIGTVCAAALAVGCYACFDVSVSFVEKMAVQSAAAEEAPAAEESGVVITESRDIKGDLLTLTGRTAIWKDVIAKMVQEPRYWIIGTTNERLADANMFPQHPQLFGNMHNGFLQILIATGVPGLLFFLCFFFVLAKESLYLFFTRRGKASFAEQFLPVTLIACVLVGVSEALYFIANRGVFNPIFFLISGFVICFARNARRRAKEAAPEAAKAKEEDTIVAA